MTRSTADRPPEHSTRDYPGATPVEIKVAKSLGPVLERWAATRGREFPWRSWTDEYRTIVVEILLQRTSADVVARFAVSFFGAYPDWTTVAAASTTELERTLTPLGLARRRSATLKSLAFLLASGERDGAYEQLSGLGQYIARAVRVARFGTTEAMIDVNFVRLVRRLFGGRWKSDYRFDARLQALGLAIIEGADDPKSANWAVLDFGALVCRARSPRCSDCPLSARCDWANQVKRLRR